MTRTLALSGALHAKLAAHLLSADGLEAAAILLCAQGHGAEANLIVRDMIAVRYEECVVREPDFIVWPGERLVEAQDAAEEADLTLILAHSHPRGGFAFSKADDDSDREVIRHLFEGWCGPTPPVIGSAIMVPGGAMKARCYSPAGQRQEMCVRVAGDTIDHYSPSSPAIAAAMAFSDEMTVELKRRTACIVGVSGTGSIAAEQAARLGFGRIILIDFDLVERKNLNRILNSTIADALSKRAKVEMFAAAIRKYRENVEIEVVRDTILCREAVIAASSADVIFCCVDSAEGRQIADLISQAYLIPLIDMGVTIPTRLTHARVPAVADVVGRIDYVQPGRSSLASRSVYTPETLRSEYLARVAPDTHAAEVAEGYIKGAHAEAPGVIALNMRAASAAMLEYIARAFPFRHEPNASYARVLFSIAEMEDEKFSEADFQPTESSVLAMGKAEPLLGLPALALAR